MDAPPNDPPSSEAPPGAPPPPTPAPPRPNGLAFFAVILGLFAFLGSAAQASSAVLGLAWSEVFALLLPAVIAAAGANLAPRPALMLSRRPAGSVLGLAIGVGAVGFLAAGALMALTSLVLPHRWVESFDVTRIFERPPAERAALAILAATVAPFCEEVAFRGWLLTSLRTRHRAPAAIGLAGLLFALMHLDPVRFGALLALGCVYGWLAWRAGSIWPSFLAHATNNGLGVVLASAGVAENTRLAARVQDQAGAIAGSAALMLALSGGVLRLVLGAYARATPAPPPVSDLLVLRDARAPSGRFDSRRVPPALLKVALVGAATLVVLVARHATRR